jgi:hypothetical protein
VHAICASTFGGQLTCFKKKSPGNGFQPVHCCPVHRVGDAFRVFVQCSVSQEWNLQVTSMDLPPPIIPPTVNNTVEWAEAVAGVFLVVSLLIQTSLGILL